MLLERFYETLVRFIARFSNAFNVKPDMYHFYQRAVQALQQKDSWDLLNFVGPSLLEHSESFRSMNVIEILSKCSLAQQCHLFELWPSLTEMARAETFAELTCLWRFARILKIICSAPPMKTGASASVSASATALVNPKFPGRYEAAIKAAILLQGKLAISGIDISTIFQSATDISQASMLFINIANELSMDASFQVSIMTLLEKEVGWDVVRECIRVFDFPPIINALADKILIPESEMSITNTNNSNSTDSNNDGSIGVATTAGAKEIKTPSLESLMPKSPDEWFTMLSALTPVMTDSKARASDDQKKFQTNDAHAVSICIQSLNGHNFNSQAMPMPQFQLLQNQQQHQNQQVMLPFNQQQQQQQQQPFMPRLQQNDGNQQWNNMMQNAPSNHQILMQQQAQQMQQQAQQLQQQAQQLQQQAQQLLQMQQQQQQQQQPMMYQNSNQSTSMLPTAPINSMLGEQPPRSMQQFMRLALNPSSAGNSGNVVNNNPASVSNPASVVNNKPAPVAMGLGLNLGQGNNGGGTNNSRAPAGMESELLKMMSSLGINFNELAGGGAAAGPNANKSGKSGNKSGKKSNNKVKVNNKPASTSTNATSLSSNPSPNPGSSQ